MFPKKRSEFKLYLFPELKGLVDDNYSDAVFTDENSEVDNSFHEHADEDHDGEPDLFKERLFEIMRTNDQIKECSMMKGQRSEDIYKKFQRDYLKRAIKNDVESFTIKIRSCKVKRDDVKRGIITYPENTPTYIDLF